MSLGRSVRKGSCFGLRALLVVALTLILSNSPGLLSARYAEANLSPPTSWTLLNGLTPDAPALVQNGWRVYLAARGIENGIWVRTWDDGAGWSGWLRVPGFTDVRPAVAVFNSRLYFVCKEAGSNRIWWGYFSLSAVGAILSPFHGWYLLDGLTPVAMSLDTSSYGDFLYLAAVGMDGSIWYRRMSTSDQHWYPWIWIPGFTDVAPAIFTASLAGEDALYFFCKQSAANSIWYGIIWHVGGVVPSWDGWYLLSGATTDAVGLAPGKYMEGLLVVARGMDNMIWTRRLSSSGIWDPYWYSYPPGGRTSSAVSVYNQGGSYVWYAAREYGTNNLWVTTVWL